jgi:hypothetical protein
MRHYHVSLHGKLLLDIKVDTIVELEEAILNLCIDGVIDYGQNVVDLKVDRIAPAHAH